MIGISTLKMRLRLETPFLALRLGGVTYFTTLIYIFPIIFTDSLPLTGTPSDTEGEFYFFISHYEEGNARRGNLLLCQVSISTDYRLFNSQF